MTSSVRDADILQQVRTILRRDLKLAADEALPEEMPFFGGNIDLDSLDMLLLVTSIERHFGVRIPNESVGKEVFQNVGALARYIEEHRAEAAVKTTAAAATVDWLARLPHGPEFRFVSRVTEVRPGEMAAGVWSVNGSEPFLAGHFPGNPIVPGVLIAEALAQISGLAGATGAGSQGKLAQIDLRFEESAVPPAEIELHAKVARQIGALQMCEVWAQIGLRVLARGSITLHRSEGK